MPTYDYACGGCGHRFERFESISESGTKTCPKCGKRKARRRLGTGVGVIFKGSGFYTTDYRSGGGASKEDSSESSSDSSSESKSEGKKEKKAEKGRKKAKESD